MTNDDFKQMLDEALKPVNQRLDDFSKELAGVKNTIETRVLPPLVYIETTVKGYADMYKINDSNIRRMEKRLKTLEENTGVEVPPEFQLEPLPQTPFTP